MNISPDHIIVYEHEVIRHDKGQNRISLQQFEALQKYHRNDSLYYKLCYNGVQFKEYVGVIQIGKTLIEVLPKSDKASHSKPEMDKWRDVLINMLTAVGVFKIKVTSESRLKKKPNTILDLYFAMFIQEVESLIHAGLVKKYRKTEGNTTALKGSLQFAKHIQKNLTHQERFYVRYTTFDVEHQIHFILYKTICLLKRINTNQSLHSKIGSLLLNFPEMPDIKVTQKTIDRLILNRKTQSYKKALDISRMILLQFHPDLSKGRNDVLALMFDMNNLWEKFVFSSLRQYNKANGIGVSKQKSKSFWKPSKGRPSTIRPDIVMKKGNDNLIILDTKWKNLSGNPSATDLRQLYVYHEYYFAKRVALVYPGKGGQNKGLYSPKNDEDKTKNECSVISIGVDTDIKEWQNTIGRTIEEWMNLKDGQQS